jgi:hypothetical protein
LHVHNGPVLIEHANFNRTPYAVDVGHRNAP